MQRLNDYILQYFDKFVNEISNFGVELSPKSLKIISPGIPIVNTRALGLTMVLASMRKLACEFFNQTVHSRDVLT